MLVVRLLIDVCRFSEWELTVDGLSNLGIECIQIARQETENLQAFDLALIDSRFPVQANLNLIFKLRSLSPSSKFIVLLDDVGNSATTYLQAGVTGLLTSIPASTKLAEIAKSILNDRYYLDQDVAQLLAMRQIKKELEPFSTLSSREFDVFCQLAEGFSLQTIASQLGISSKTVSNCQTQIKLKLGLSSRDQITLFAKKHGLLVDKAV